MSIFCKHEWQILVKTIAPSLNIAKLGDCSEEFAKKLIFGVTTVLLQCKKCPEVRKEEMLGMEAV